MTYYRILHSACISPGGLLHAGQVASSAVDVHLRGAALEEGARHLAEVHVRESLLECGVQAPVLTHGSKREKTVFQQKPTGSLFCSYRNLRTSPETSRSLWDNVI